MKKLTWEDLAEFYKKKTGGRARTMKMSVVFDWAAKQKEIIKNEDGSLSFKDQPIT